MRKLAFLGLAYLATSILFSCQHEPLEDMTGGGTTPPDTTGTGENSCDPDSVYFVNQIYPILQSNCAFSGCHGGGSAQDGVDLTSYESIIRTADVKAYDLRGSDLYEMITESDPDKRMPPPPNNPLSSEQIGLIANWINQGALNNQCESCDTTNVSFKVDIEPLIANTCQGCHSGTFPNAGVRLSSYEEIKTQAQSGSLLAVIRHEPGYVPMPYNQPQLSDCRIEQVRLWIEEGALNN